MPPPDELAPFGYRQELRRSLGGFSAFAAGFSFVSILTTVFQLFGFGYTFGGPLFFWTWPVVLAGQLLVALVFAELAARFPLAGSVYQWAKQLSKGFLGWLAGWMMLLGCVVALAAAAIALQVVLPSVWDGFQLVGGDPAVTSPTGAANAVVLGTLLLVFTTAVNTAGVRLMARINDVGVAAELLGVVVLVTGLALFAVRGPQVVLHDAPGTSAGIGGVLASALMAAYVLYGFDTAASVAEETKDARRAAPRAVLRAVLVSGLGGLAVVVTALMAAPSLTDGQLAGHGLPYVITAVFGDTLGRVFLADVAIAVVVCTLTIQTGTVRLIYAMARDGALPASTRLAVGEFAHGDAGRARAAVRRARDRAAAAQRRQPDAVQHDHRDVGGGRLPGVPAGHRTPAGAAAARALPGRARAVLPRPLGRSGERGGRSLRRRHDREHRLAARGDLRRDRFGRALDAAVPDRVRRRRAGARPALLAAAAPRSRPRTRELRGRP